MNLKKFNAVLAKKIKDRDDIVLEKYRLKYNKGLFWFWKIRSKKIEPKDKVVLIRAGIHGDEIAGPATVLKYINQIIDYAHSREIKIIIYPLGNPSGYQLNTRYNIDGEKNNNDFVRYELPDGSFTDDLKEDDKFKKWYWSSDKKLGLKLPRETSLMHRIIKKDPLKQIVGAIDLHQDYITPDAKPTAYQYPFGDLKNYETIISKISKIIPLLKNTEISAGEPSATISDEDGSIVRHDGVLADLFCQLGAKYAITVETTGVTPIKKAHQVNLIWIYGIIDLVRSELIYDQSLTATAEATLLPKIINEKK